METKQLTPKPCCKQHIEAKSIKGPIVGRKGRRGIVWDVWVPVLGTVMDHIHYCPWCGAKLESLKAVQSDTRGSETTSIQPGSTD